MARRKLYYLSLMLIAYSNVAIAQPHHQEGEGGGFRGFFRDSEEEKSTAEQIQARRQKFLEEKEKLSKMNAEEKITFIEQKRKERLQKMEEKFKSMTDKDKIEFVNKRYAKMREKMEERWNSMSKEEKISFVEEKINRHGERGLRRFRREDRD